MHTKFALLFFFLVCECAQVYAGHIYTNKSHIQANTQLISRCNTFPSERSVFVTFRIPPFMGITYLIGNDFVHAQPSVSFSTPLFEIGVQDEFPVGSTQADFLYLIIIDRNEPESKQKRIYCFDLNGKSVEIIPSRGKDLPLRIIVSPKEMKVYQDDYETVRYQTLEGRHILTVDISDGRIESLEIKPLDSLPARLVKPKPSFKYCREALTNRKVSALLVCPSDGLEFVLGFFPRLIGRFSPVMGWITLLLVEGGTFILLLIKAFEQKHFWKTTLLLVFIGWLILVAANIWPYALLYP